MSWSDVLFPGNFQRRQDVYRLMQKVLSCLEFTFDASKELIEIVNKYLMAQSEQLMFTPMNKTGTIGDNCKILVKMLEETQKVVATRFSRLAEKLNPEIYRKLFAPDVSFMEVVRLSKSISQAVIGITGGVAGVVVCSIVARMRCVTQAATVLQKVSRIALAELGVALATLAVDLVVSAIIGAVERSKLNNAIKELVNVLNDLEPASKKFCKKVIQVGVLIENEFE